MRVLAPSPTPHPFPQPESGCDHAHWVQARGYAVKEGRGLKPTARGKLVVAFLQSHFARYLDYDYTSDMESQLDEVAGASASVDTSN